MMAATKDIRVPKALHGKIIGKQAATLRDIESDYPGVKVRVPKRDDPSEIIRLTGPADAVSRAERRVMDISGALSDAATERARADALRKEKDALFEQASRTRDRVEKKKLLDAAHAKKREVEVEERAAAERIFAAKNSGYGLEQIDLHGLHLEEATQKAQERLGRLEAGEVAGGSVEIITGAGHHSKGHQATIRLAVEAMLRKKRRLTFEGMIADGGFVVRLREGVTPTGAPTFAQCCAARGAREERGSKSFLTWLARRLTCFSR